MSTPEAGGPLRGTRVIELGTVVAGPFAGRVLADFGADVIKIEAPDRPDPLRDWGQAAYRGHRLWWTVHARNKRCVTLDLRSRRGQDLLLELVATADVLIENFRPGTLERWNLGWERLRTVNRGLVLARLSGYGQTGPYAGRPGYASVAEAMSGLRAINGHPGEAPPRMAVSLGDSLGGMVAVQGVLAALLHRAQTGEGQVVDIALTEACLAVTESLVPEYDRLGRVRRPGGTRLDGIAPSNLFRSADGQWVIVAANQDTIFRRLCTVMGKPELADDPRFADHRARGENQDEIDDLVAEWVSARTASEVAARLEEAGVVVGQVYTAADIVADPHFRARGALVSHHDERVDDDVLGPGIVPVFSRTPGRVRWAGPPEPGTHNDEVYRELLGLTADDLEDLAKEGVV
ncbi:CaiB/BaiF CoA transferase family protein [Amycolatopsis jiangsuensis]|uniref:Formyl-CoA transferase n=1 Tax=Amycolatopsis jiangsuensis TaxID=1181879 RepID=A0A840J7J1_9PSEU|nr:CaiB/BaiF CoA-transferase family protein [Amycolatopsis jiangsuensis]MBB4689679.1 formyl-CoA transferase [Amycolatopsis jiangsuensis]